MAKPLQGTDLSTSSRKLVRDMDLFSSIGKLVRGVDSLSNVERSLSKGTRNRELESVQLSQMEMEKIPSEEKKAFMNTLKGKLIELFKENMQLRQDYVKRRLNWTEENGTGEMLILLFLELADILNPRE